MEIKKIGYELVKIPGGTLMMGSPEDEKGRDNDEALHEVIISSFFMGKYPVTNEQYYEFMLTQPDMREPRYWRNRNFNQPTQPVVGVSWENAMRFAKWSGLRIPTEAEWEYACRAGTTTPFHTGNCLSTDQANYDGNHPYSGCAKGEYREKTIPVGSLAKNDWGLYDMHGNVWEWCSDWYGEDYYEKSPASDPAGPASGSLRVLRGGGWYDGAGYCRSAFRNYDDPGFRYDDIGFRLAK